MEIEEVKGIKESSTIKKNLIGRIQELEYSSISEDSEEAIVNLALMNFLLDLKYLKSDNGFLETDVYETVDSIEEINVISKVVKGNSIEGLLTNLTEDLIDYNECISKY